MASGIPLKKFRLVTHVERLGIPGVYFSLAASVSEFGRHPVPSLMLRAGEAEIALGTEYIGVKARDPLPPARGDVEIPDRGLAVRRDALPIELRIKVRDIGRRRVAQLTVQPDFLELLVQRVGLAEVMGIAQLSDQIGG